MEIKLSKNRYRYYELFGEILRITKGDLEYGHRAIRHLILTGQIQRRIWRRKIRYFVLYEKIEVPYIRIQYVRNYTQKKTLKYPEEFGEIRVFVYTLRPLKFGRRADRYDYFKKIVDEVEEKVMFSFKDAVLKQAAYPKDGFEDREVLQIEYYREKEEFEKHGIIIELEKIFIFTYVYKKDKYFVFEIWKEDNVWKYRRYEFSI